MRSTVRRAASQCRRHEARRRRGAGGARASDSRERSGTSGVVDDRRAGPRGALYAGPAVDGVSALYLPAGVRPGERLRVAYLLAGRGAAAGLAQQLAIAEAGDQLSWQRTTPPFAVVVTSAQGRAGALERDALRAANAGARQRRRGTGRDRRRADCAGRLAARPAIPAASRHGHRHRRPDPRGARARGRAGDARPPRSDLPAGDSAGRERAAALAPRTPRRDSHSRSRRPLRAGRAARQRPSRPPAGCASPSGHTAAPSGRE